MVNPHLTIRAPDDDRRSEKSEKTRPNSPPPQDDRFRKTMRDREERGENEAVTEEENAPSVFDLSKSKAKGSQKPTSVPIKGSRDKVNSESKDKGGLVSQVKTPNLKEPETAQTEESSQGSKLTPVKPFPSKMTETKEPLESARMSATVAPPKEKAKITSDKSQGVSSKKEVKDEKKTGSASLDQKKTLEGSVFSAPSTVEFRTETTAQQQSVSRASQIADLVDELVKRIEVMQKGGETHTTITLSHPPMFKDATITLTTSEQTKREFNVSFANLSPEGKNILDQALKDQSLTRQMDKRDIIIHVITTSTEPQTLFTAESSSGSSRDRGGEGQQQQQQQQQRQREREQQPEEE